MKIDWKHLASTEGYKSLKNELCGINRHRKAEYLRKFNWVIARAKHYAQFQDRTLEEVLNEWEKNRNGWWLGHYKESAQPRLNKSDSVRPKGHNSVINKYKNGSRTEYKKIRVLDYMREVARKSRTKKPKWSSARKKEANYWRKRNL